MIINGKIEEFVQWYDEDGNIINASDGGMIFAEGKYHWYGMALRPLPFAGEGLGGQTTTKGVVMYASEDLCHWKYEGVILACSGDPHSPLYGPMRFERPKIVYNKNTGQYVLWCHYVKTPGDHGFTEGTAEAGVAVCNEVNGSYTWLGTTRPIDERGLVRDCTVFQDDDGSAYFIYDRQVGEDRCLHIVKLSDDYLSCTDQYKRLDAAYWREAAALVKHQGYYYMITSDLTSWAANQAKYFRTKELMGEWEDMGDPCEGDDTHTTFHSQSTYIFHVEGQENLYIHMAERHNTENFERCSYIWLPITFHEDHTLSLHYQEQLEISCRKFPYNNIEEMDAKNVRYGLRIDYYPPLPGKNTVDLRFLADDKTVLRNPHKGWFWHYVDNGMKWNPNYRSTTGGPIDPNDHLEDFPGLNHLYLRFDWSDVETREGEPDWSWIDHVMEEWEKYDYRFSLRICCYEADGKHPFTTPEYVYKAGAKGYALSGGRLQPDYGDPVFLEKLEAFLQKAGEKFNKDPRIELIDVGTIGTWGEGHTGYGDERIYPASVIKKHLELHAKYFLDTFVLMNDDHINTGWARGVVENEALIEYARRMKFGLQDDSVCCEGYAGPNGYDTLRTPWLFDMMWENAPIVLEFEHYRKVWEDPDIFKDGLPFLEAMKNTHATYAGFHGFPRPWLERVPYLTEYCANRLGYWYFVESLEISDINNGRDNEVCLHIRNKGFGLCYHKYTLRLALCSRTGDSFIQEFDADNREWKPDREVKVSLQLHPEGLRAGEYELWLGLFDKNRPIELAIRPDRKKEGMYYLCNVKVQ